MALASANHEVANGPMPDPALLRVFLRSKDSDVGTQAFKWCIELTPISRPSSHGDGDSTGVFIPQPMGYEWVEHFIHVLCTGNSMDRVGSWGFLESHLVPKFTTLPSSWCYDFASAFLFSILHPSDGDELPAYQSLGISYSTLAIDKRESYLHFVAAMLELMKSDLSWARLKIGLPTFQKSSRITMHTLSWNLFWPLGSNRLWKRFMSCLQSFPWRIHGWTDDIE